LRTVGRGAKAPWGVRRREPAVIEVVLERHAVKVLAGAELSEDRVEAKAVARASSA